MMHIGSSKGFTLVELVATLIIIVLIAAVSGPLFSNVDVFRQRGFFEETLSAVRYAQKYAVATGCGVQVIIGTNGFALHRPANIAACSTGPYVPLIADPSGNNPAGFSRAAPNGVTLSVHNFTFAADGAASANQSINVGGTTFQVVAATGFVSR